MRCGASNQAGSRPYREGPNPGGPAVGRANGRGGDGGSIRNRQVKWAKRECTHCAAFRRAPRLQAVPLSDQCRRDGRPARLHGRLAYEPAARHWSGAARRGGAQGLRRRERSAYGRPRRLLVPRRHSSASTRALPTTGRRLILVAQYNINRSPHLPPAPVMARPNPALDPFANRLLLV